MGVRCCGTSCVQLVVLSFGTSSHIPCIDTSTSVRYVSKNDESKKIFYKIPKKYPKFRNLFLDLHENFLPELLSSDPKTCFFPNWKLETGNWKLETGNTD